MKEAIVRLDIDVARYFADMRSDSLNEFFYVVTQLGSTWFILAFTIVVAGYLYWKMHSYFLPFILSVAGSSLTVTIIKEVIQRARPGADFAFYAEHLFSFPSGHTASAVVAFGFCAYLLARVSQKALYKILISVFAAVLIGLVAVSRIYLGVHFLSDVIAGFLVGGFWLLAGIALHAWSRRHKK